MKGYAQKYLDKIQNVVMEVDISPSEKKYCILKDKERGELIHQIIHKGIEVIKLSVKINNYYEYTNKNFENCIILRYLKSGELTIKYSEDEKYLFKAGEIFLSAGNKEAKEILIPKVDVKIEELIIIFSEEYLESFIDDLEIAKSIKFLRENTAQNNKKIIKNLQNRLIGILDRLMKYELNLGKKLFVYSKINEILSEIISSFLKNIFELDDCLDDEIENIRDYIEENFGRSNILVDIHKKFYMNRGELSKKFKEKTDMNMHEYLKKIKLEKAYTMLKYEDKKVSEVANFAGYENYGYFSKIFKKYFGVYPVEIKKSRFIAKD